MFCEVDDVLALGMRASLLLSDDDLEQRAPEPPTVDRVSADWTGWHVLKCALKR